MAEDYSDRPVSRATLMEIQTDREVMEQGYQFLDEKLVLLAQELLRRLRDYEERGRRYRDLEGRAREALAAAVARHGLDGLQVYPPADLGDARLPRHGQTFLGVRLLSSEGLAAPPESGTTEVPFRPSREARECAGLFRELAEEGAGLALAGANLHRLLAEYERTEQRAEALSNVILPEIRQAQWRMSERIEEGEQEEAVRIRLFAPAGDGI